MQAKPISKIRELFSDSLIYGLSSVIARFINYLLVPFYTLYFTPAEYGIVGLLFAAIVFLNVIYSFGMESSYIRYASISIKNNNKQETNRIFTTVQLAILSVATLLTLLLYAFADPHLLPLMSLNFDGGERLFAMMLVILWLDALSIVPYAHLRIAKKAINYALIKLFNVLLNVGLNLYLVIVAGMGIEAIFISNILASALSLLLLTAFTLPMYKAAPELSLLKPLLLFGLPYVPNGIGFAINEVMNRFFLVRMSPEQIFSIYNTPYTPEEITGIFNACYKMAVFMLLCVQMFRLAWQPFFMRYASDKESPELFARVFLYFNTACAIIFVSISLYTPLIVALEIPVLNGTIIDSRYWSGLHIVPVLLMAYWFQGWFINLTAGIFIREKTITLPKITLYGSVITIAGNMLLVPYFGMLGSAMATLGCYAVMSLVALLYSMKVYPVPYPMRGVITMMIFSIAIVLCDLYLPAQIGLNERILKLILLIIGIGGILFITRLSLKK
ncbi:MAG: polysaccharide biosynthesis C-terminal domain-containing protein [Balneolales bacterium]|nr:polysaccharide biosynthesis C-terminal domain-containing protein [Balneolales bacterium]